MQCHPHPAQYTERPTVNRRLSARTYARNNENQQISGSNYHRQTLLDQERQVCCCQWKSDGWLPLKKLQGMLAKNEIGNLHHNGLPHAPQQSGILTKDDMT